MSPKLLYGAIFLLNENNKLILLCKSSVLKHYAFYKRSTIEQFCTFLCREMGKKSNEPGRVQVIRDSEYYLDLLLAKEGYSDGLRAELHKMQILTYSHDGKFVITFISDLAYPSNGLARLARAILQDFTNTFDKIDANKDNKDLNIDYQNLRKKLEECQNPSKIDQIAEMQASLGETTNIMIQNINTMFMRGEKMEDLLAKTNDLNESSKKFIIQSQKLNRWCC